MAGVECVHEIFSDEVNEELQALSAIYSGDGEFIIKDSDASHGDDGKSAYLRDIHINPRDMMGALCFSLPVPHLSGYRLLAASYPEISPRIEIVSPPDTMSDDDVAKLLVHLYHVAQENAGCARIYSLVESARDWMQEHQIPVGEVLLESNRDNNKTSDNQSPNRDKSKKERGKQEKKPHLTDAQKADKPTKKPPMKTATDVISRVQWDDQLNIDHFIVGYLDRFTGIVEQPFTAFYWEDISAVDHHTLAIPRHRIQYFKYKDEVVWDKTRRLDNVFGSQGSGVTITDVVQRYSKENASEGGSVDEKEWDDMEDTEINSGDEFEAKGSATAPLNSVGRPRVRKSRPNYFIGIGITDDDVRTHVKQIQDHMADLDPHVNPYLISQAHLHITLCMLQLNSDSQISNALSVLKSIQHELMSMLLPVTFLRFEGVDTFHDRIVYVKLQANPVLKQLSHCVQNSLRKAGISLTGTREEFVPHLTIMKMPREEMNSHPTFTSDLRTKYLDVNFGCQVVDAIHLCSIDIRPAPDKFYYSLAKIDLLE